MAFTFIYQWYWFIWGKISDYENQSNLEQKWEVENWELVNSQVENSWSKLPVKTEEKFSYFNDLSDSNWAYIPLRFAEENWYFFVDENENIYPEKWVTFMETLKIFNLIYNIWSDDLAKKQDVKFKYLKKGDKDYYAMKYWYYSWLIWKEFDPYQVITKKYLLTFFWITLWWDYDNFEWDIFDKNFEAAKEKWIIWEYSKKDYESKVNRAIFATIIYRIFNQ